MTKAVPQGCTLCVARTEHAHGKAQLTLRQTCAGRRAALPTWRCARGRQDQEKEEHRKQEEKKRGRRDSGGEGDHSKGGDGFFGGHLVLAQAEPPPLKEQTNKKTLQNSRKDQRAWI